MRFALPSLVLASVAIAGHLNERFVDDGINLLTKRQQFIPTTTTAEGETCADAFGDGYVTCREKTDTKNRLCYNPAIGQVCCQNVWACPSGSFCLVENECCPTGSDPKTCAEANGVSITSNFQTSGTSAPTAKNGTVSFPKATTTGSQAHSTPAGDKSNAGAQLQLGGLVGAAGMMLGAAALL